jgi:hypothetical protein
MELPKKSIAAERVLGCLFLAAIFATALVERRSPLATAIREKQPWMCRLKIKGPGRSEEFLGIYAPKTRVFDVIYPLRGHAELPEIYEKTDAWPADEAPLAAKRILLKNQGSPRRWASSGLSGLMLKIYLASLDRSRIHAIGLPDQPAQQQELLDRLLADEEELAPAALSVEILNASSRDGIATLAAKILRSQGADVVSMGNAPSQIQASVVYARAGGIEKAEAVRESLGCEKAETVLSLSPSKLIDASVVIGEDCSEILGRTKWKSLKF